MRIAKRKHEADEEICFDPSRRLMSGLSCERNSHGQKNSLPLASTLQTLKAILGAAQATVDRCLVSNDLVKSIAVRDGVLVVRQLSHTRPSHLNHLFGRGFGEFDHDEGHSPRTLLNNLANIGQPLCRCGLLRRKIRLQLSIERVHDCVEEILTGY